MTHFKLLGATLILSVLLATPASAWEASEPAAAAAQDPTFSIYSTVGRGYSAYGMVSQAPLGDGSGQHTSVRPRHRNHTVGVKRY